jgi:hypothetical protein
MSNLKTYATAAGVLALLLTLTAAPAALSQEGEPPPGHHGMQHHGKPGEMPPGHAEKMAEHRAKMAEHREAMEAHMARMDELVAQMNQATGDAKVDAVAAVLNEMWSHHQSMREEMGGMGMAMMGHGKMGHGAGCPCPMHGEGSCPMMGEEDDSGQ